MTTLCFVYSFCPSKQHGDAEQPQLLIILRFILSSISWSIALNSLVSYPARDLTVPKVLLKGSWGTVSHSAGLLWEVSTNLGINSCFGRENSSTEADLYWSWSQNHSIIFSSQFSKLRASFQAVKIATYRIKSKQNTSMLKLFLHLDLGWQIMLWTSSLLWYG